MVTELQNSAEIITEKSGRKSVIARRDISAGEVLGENLNFISELSSSKWPILTFEEANRLPEEYRSTLLKFAYSIDMEGRICGPLNIDYCKEIDFLNHSCDPNCWWGEEGDTLVARRNIKKGVCFIRLNLH